MEHLRETKEIVEEEAEESPQVGVPSDPTLPTTATDVSTRGRGRVGEMPPPVSASLGAMRALVWKLDKLLLASPRGRGCCSSKRVEDGMRLLREDVEDISSCLDELSQVDDPPTMAKCWMNEARDLSYDMDDYADSLFLRPAEEPFLVADNIKTTRSRLKWFTRVRTPKKPMWDEQIEGEFRMYVKDAMKRHDVYGLKLFSTKKRTLVSIGSMLPKPNEETIVISGRMNEFINSLAANDGANQLQLKVLSVLGSACLGKTTLARVLYDRIGKQYDCQAFIRVSKKPNMKKIFRDMLWQLCRQDPPQNCEEIVLIDITKRSLKKKRYLVIIDDLWDASLWDIISRAFPEGTHGSRIITTTQIEDVAFRCCCYQPEHVFEMKPLDDYDSRKLFFNRIFGYANSCPQKLREGLNKVVQICGGLPLATSSVASLLASQPVITVDLLKHIHESLSSCFMTSSTSERTRQALNLSFSNLPDYLKTCLLYLRIYPEGSIIWRGDVVKQWVAESLIDTTEGKDMEEVAGSYLDQLFGRRFIHPITLNYRNEVLSFEFHDMVHDLIANKSEEENFIVAIGDSPTNMGYNTRRLSILFEDARYAKIPENIGKSQVRSVTYYGLSCCVPCFKEFKLLRVLNLQLSYHDCNNGLADLTGISELFQLRYLKIASDVCIKLPNPVPQCLETLDIADASSFNFPWDVNFPHLLHLHLSPVVIDPLLIEGLGKLNYLKELYLTLPSSASREYLKINIEALGQKLGGHGNLKTIVLAHGPSVITWHSARYATDTISWQIMEPPPLLQEFDFPLQRSCMFNQIPQWVGKLSNLRILKIAVAELPIDDVDMLRGLPALTVLSLYVHMAPDEKIICGKDSGFSVLKYFKLRCTIGLVWLQLEADAMPNLSKLKLVFNDIPSWDRQYPLYSTKQGRFKQHQRGAAFITIDHMPGLREISAKFKGDEAANIEYALRTGFSNHQNNPIMKVYPSCYGGEVSTEEKRQPAEDEIVKDEPGERKEKQPGTFIEKELDKDGKTLDRTGDDKKFVISTSSPQKSAPVRRRGIFQRSFPWSNASPSKPKQTATASRSVKFSGAKARVPGLKTSGALYKK